MIPALLALPMVEGVVGSVMNAFAPSQPAAPEPAASAPATFAPYLNRASTALASAPAFASSGIMRADQWSQMSGSDLQSWTKSLSGMHVDATDGSGRTISGLVGGVQQLGDTLALNIGGHLVSLSSLKQITWSPSVA